MSIAEFCRELVFPLRSSALLIAIVFTTLLLTLASAAGVFGVALGFLVGVGLLKYLVDVFAARAKNLKVPVPDVDTFNPGLQGWKLGVAIVTFSLFFIVHYAEAHFGFAGAIAATIVCLAVWPAMLINAGMSQAVVAMFALPTLAKIMQRMGIRYWAIGAAVLLALALSQLASIYLNALLGSVLSNYAQVMVYSFAGAMVYASREALGLELRRSPEGRQQQHWKEIKRRRMSYMDRAYLMFSRGNPVGGRLALDELLGSEPASLELDRWIFRILAAWSEPAAMLLFAPRLIDSLLDAGETGEALSVFSQCLARDPTYARGHRQRERLMAEAERLGNTSLLEAIREG